MKVIIVSGGYNNCLFLKNELNSTSCDLLIGVDGGGVALNKVNVLPDVLLGDFDSIDSNVLKIYEEKNINIIPYPPEKDMTDTDIAIEYAINHGATEIIIYGGLGTRLDHTLGNIFILEKYYERCNISIINENNHIRLLQPNNKIEIQSDRFAYLSLIPVSNIVKSVTTKGLKYELSEFDLVRKDSLGVSNEIVEETSTVFFEKGLLLLILSKD